MELTLSVFLSQAGDHPVLLGILALVIGVTIISGATDAPNAIASAVSTVEALERELLALRRGETGC